MGFPFAGFPDGFFMYNLMPTKTSSLWRIHISIYSMPLVFASRHWPGGEGMVRRYHSRHGVAPLPPRQRLSSSQQSAGDLRRLENLRRQVESSWSGIRAHQIQLVVRQCPSFSENIRRYFPYASGALPSDCTTTWIFLPQETLQSRRDADWALR